MNRRGLPIFMITLGVLSASLVGARPARLSEDARSRLAPALAKAFDGGDETFRVIARLEAGAAARFPLSPRGLPQPAARVDEVRHTVKRELDKLANRIPSSELKVSHTYRLWPYIAARVNRAGLEKLLADANVAYVDVDEVWFAQTAQGIPLIHGDVMHQLGFTGAGTAVAVIDTGVDYNHPTLGGGAIPNDKIVFGKDTANGDDDPIDCGDHGTAVASIIAGTPFQWSEGPSFFGGVAPDAKILAYKASPDDKCGTFHTSDVIAAVDDIIQKRDTYNIVAINLSIGGSAKSGPCDNTSTLYSKAIDDATQAGIAVLVAAGNEAEKDKLDTPACVSNAISVGAVYDRNFARSFRWGSPGDILCTDFNPQVKSVACYSDSDPFLDLLAPASVTTVAAANGTTKDFNGTSAATPYASGAVAVLSQALGDQDPALFRFLFELTGEPITDSANGVTAPLIDLTAASTASGIGLGNPTNVPIPNATGSPAVSTTSISEAGAVKSVRVNVKIAHTSPTDLVVTLISPQGTRVKLHDHGPGSSTLAGNLKGVYADYPNQNQPAESLDAFLGEPAAGTWTLEVLDDNPSSITGVSPRLIGWGLSIGTGTGQGDPPAFTSYMIPVAAHLPGLGDPPTFWITDLRIFNPSLTQGANFDLFLIPEGKDGRVDFLHTPVNVPPNSVLSLPDVLQNRFGINNDKGNLVVQANGTNLLMTSRTYNSGSSIGTFGQFVGSARGIAAVGKGDGPLTMLQLESNSSFRTNIGFSEASGQSAEVKITLYDGDTGQVLGTPHTYTVQPFSNRQVSRIFDTLGAGSSSNAYATAEVVGGVGRIEAYATPVDRATGESIFVPGTQPITADYQMIPIVASLPGENGFWVTDVRILNAASSTAQVTLEFRPSVGDPGSFKAVTKSIAPGQVLSLDDIVPTLFGFTNTKGSLRVIPGDPATPLIVTSRTWTSNEAGTYGQFVPAVEPSAGFGSADQATVLHMDGGTGFQSNIGICELSGGTASVRYVLKDADGQTLETGSVDLGPYQVRHITDVFQTLGVTPQDNTRVDFFLDSGTGTFTAYGTLVDTNSKDAIYVPAQKY